LIIDSERPEHNQRTDELDDHGESLGWHAIGLRVTW
jgi:hypothetical protein